MATQMERPMANESPALDVLDRGASAERGATATCGSPAAKNRATGRKSAPPDLLAFVRAQSVSAAARELGLTRQTIYRLREGYWPRNSDTIMTAWRACQCELADRASRWVVRRVYLGGVVLHGGRSWTADGLAAREGQSLAVARAEGFSLLAQTLELPPERLLLREVA